MSMNNNSQIEGRPARAAWRGMTLVVAGSLLQLTAACAGPQDFEIEQEGLALDALSKAGAPITPRNASGLCLESINGAVRNGVAVYLVNCDASSVQKWTINASANTIQVGSRMCLDVQDGENKVGAAVQLWQCFKDNTNQKFEVSGNAIRWRNTDKCVAPKGGAVSGAKLQLVACSDTAAAQVWQLASTGTTEAPQTTPEPTQSTPTPSAPSAGNAISGDQSGTGWGGADLLDPKSTATYRAPSLDGLLAMSNSLVAKTIGPQADIVAAIRRVTQETGVPSGLLAAMIVQESNGDRTTTSNNPGYGSQPPDQRKDVGIIQSPLWKFEGATTAEKLKNGQDPYKNLRVFADEASDVYKRTGSWGQVAQVWYTGYTADRLGGVTGGASSERNYVLNVFSHLAMGGSTYYPPGGY